MNLNRLITVKQAVEITGISDGTLRKEIDRGNLKAIFLGKNGKHAKIHLMDLEEYCKKVSVSPNRKFAMYLYDPVEFLDRVDYFANEDI